MNSLLRSAIGLLLIAGCSGSDSGDDDRGTTVNQPATGEDAGTSGGGNNGQSTGANGSNTGGSTSGGNMPDNTPPTTETPLTDGCSGQKLREGIPEDLAKPGPWPVGAKTTMLGKVVTEVWYPAKQGSEKGQEKIKYDIREHLPPDDVMKIPDDHNPWQTCNCFRDLPLDEEAGPYPVLLFIHGTAGFRTTNLDNATHWASRGFVVIAADHPGIQLKDMLGTFNGSFSSGNSNQAQNGRDMLAELAMTSGDVAFLKDHIDMTKVGAMGHSAGGGAVAGLGDIADVIIVYAAGQSVANPSRAKSVMNVMGSMDSVAGSGTGGYDGTTTTPKRFVSIANGGHLVGGNLCTLRDPTDPSQDIVDLAEKYKLGGFLIQLVGIRTAFGTLFNGCNENMDDPMPFIPATRGIEVMNYVSAGAFEETLHCASGAAAKLSATKDTFGADVADYKETL